jgi:Tol biopolymer transport system component
LLGIAAAALIAAVAGGFWIASRPATPVVDSSAMRFEIPPAIRVAEAGTFGLSPDGRRIVFIGTGADGRFRMWERSLDSLETRPINGSEGEVSGNTTLFWSPDGSSIGFYADGAVRRIAREGGTATVVCRVRGIAVGGTWNAAGDIVVGNTAGGLMRCPASGGEAVPLTAGGSDTAGAAPSIHLFPVFLRDGQRLLYLRVSRADPSLNGLFIADLQLSPEQQSQTRVLETGFGARYSVDESGERIIFVRNRDLWAVPFSSDRGVTEGEPVQIATSVYTFRDGASFDVQRNMLVFRGGAGGYQLMLRNRSGEELSQIGEPGSYAGVALSPDGTRVAVTRENQLNRSDQDIWFIDVARGTTSRFTADPLPESAPAWSADGRSVVFASGHDDATIRARRLDGEEQILLDHKALDQMTVNPLLATFSASRDGRWLVFNMDTRGQRRSDIWILPLQEPRQPKPLIEGQFDQRQPRISPDQRWLAYVSNESGADEVYVRPLTWGDAPATGAAVVVSRRGGRSPRWSGDSQELLFQSLNGEMMSALVNGTSFAEATPLFAAPGALAEWDVTADGQRLLLAHPTDSRELPFTVVVNWRQTRD